MADMHRDFPTRTAFTNFPRLIRRRSRPIAVTALTVLLASTLAGCWSDSSAPNPSTSSATRPSAAAPTSTSVTGPIDTSQVTQWSADCVQIQVITGSGSEIGPLSPADRKPVCTTVNTVGTAVVSNVDFGDLALPATESGANKQDFRTPVRGVLVTPAQRGAVPAPLVVMSHLRAQGCVKDVQAYPCPDGKERRMDQGMTYFGEQLAAKGYAVLIPDLSPLYIAQELKAPYDQYLGYQKIIGTMLGKLREANAGTSAPYGADFRNTVDTSKAGLLVHSRSAYMAGPAIDVLAKSPTKISTVMGYGAALNSPGSEGDFTPDLPDLPTLLVQGYEDSDTGLAANRWTSEYLGNRRTSPLMAAVVPGLGHNYINRTLSQAKLDEREACDAESNCPDAPAHEKFLVATASTWFDATLRKDAKAAEQFPMTQAAAMPTKLSGLDARWLVRAPGARTVVYEPKKVGSLSVVGSSKAKPVICRTYLPEDPRVHPDACPNGDGLGILESPSNTVLFDAAPGTGVRIETTASTAKAIDLALTPATDRADRGKGSPLQVIVRSGNQQQIFRLAATDPAVGNRGTAEKNGVYVVTTARLMLSEEMSKLPLTSLEITGAEGLKSRIALRQVAFLTG